MGDNIKTDCVESMYAVHLSHRGQIQQRAFVSAVMKLGILQTAADLLSSGVSEICLTVLSVRHQAI